MTCKNCNDTGRAGIRSFDHDNLPPNERRALNERLECCHCPAGRSRLEALERREAIDVFGAFLGGGQ